LKVITTQNAPSPALVWRRLPVTRRRRITVLIGQMARRHRDRVAIVYLRQSTPQQVGRHQESTHLMPPRGVLIND
jgi:hypothetical protein